MRISDWSSDVCSSDLLDLAVARQRGVVVDAQAGGGLELGLVVVADAAFGHQPRGFVGEAPPAFARARFGVLAGAVHVASRQEIRAACTTCAVEVDGGVRPMPVAACRARQGSPRAARSNDLRIFPTLPRPALPRPCIRRIFACPPP